MEEMWTAASAGQTARWSSSCSQLQPPCDGQALSPSPCLHHVAPLLQLISTCPPSRALSQCPLSLPSDGAHLWCQCSSSVHADLVARENQQLPCGVLVLLPTIAGSNPARAGPHLCIESAISIR